MRGTAQPTQMTASRAMAGGLPRAIGLGLLSGAVIGLLAALLSVPLRRLAGVTDRAVVNGLSVIGGALLLWLAGGVLYGLAARRGVRAATWLFAAMAAVALVAVVVFLGPAADFTTRLPSLAIPLTLIVTLGGAAVFLALDNLRAPLALATPAAVVLAVVVASFIYVNDTRPAVHYTLSNLSASAVTKSAAPAAPAAAGQPTSSGQSGAVPAAATPSAPTPAPTPAPPLHFVVSNQSEAAFTVNEKLTRLPAPSDAIGKTNAITGDLYLLPGGLAKDPPSAFSVDLRTLTSDAPPRDRYIKQNTLDTNQFPFATFTIASVDGWPTAYKEGDRVKLSVTGAFNVHGVEKPLTWTGEAQMAGGKLEAVASADFDMHDFNITPPSVPVVQSVDSHVHLDIHLLADQQGS